MITKRGQEQHLKLIAGKARVFADKFLIGASDKTLDQNANDLDFTWGSFPVSDTVIDYENKQVLFYGTIPATLAGEIREIGLSSSDGATVDKGALTNWTYGFGASELWHAFGETQDVTFASGNSKLGGENLVWKDAKTGERVSYFENDGIDFSGADIVKVKFTASKAATVRLYLATSDDAHIYKDISLVNGENTLNINIADFTKVGTYNSSLVRGIILESRTNTVNYEFDGIVFSDSTKGALMMREIVDPVTKRAGSSMEIEMVVELNV